MRKEKYNLPKGLLMKQFKYLKEIIIVFEKLLVQYGGEVIPCTEEEINVLESMLLFPYNLPIAFKEFLLYGGKEMGSIFSVRDFSYQTTKNYLEGRYNFIFRMFKLEDPNARFPSDIFVISRHISSNFTYILLSEGENPPVYWWEESEGGLEKSQKINDSFSNFLRETISIKATYLLIDSRRNNIQAGKPPHSKQFWIPNTIHFTEGITSEVLMKYLGFYFFSTLEEAATIIGVDPNSYLEELSGWKCRKITEDDTEVRFFPPETWEE